MLNNATIEKAERNEISNSARDMIKFVQNNYSFNMEELPDLVKHFINVVPHLLSEVRKNDHSGSSVSETTSADGSDPLPQTKSTYHTPQSSILELVDISDMVPANPSSLPVTSIADLYICSMLKCLTGYPLYEPEPLSELSTEYLRHGVNVGDVGFVRGDGAFDFLFNICPSQNSLINPLILPGGFSLETASATRSMRPLPRETHLFRSPITRTSYGEYTCRGHEGAVLELPEGAIQEEAMNVLSFENLAARYGVEWYKYTMSRGRAIPNGSLYLITSFTKCPQWGIAVFDQPCASGQGLKFDSGTSFPFSFWNSTSKYRWKGSNTSNTKVANPIQGNASAPNQCVFLRGYKIMIRQDIFDNLRKDQRRGTHTSMPPPSPQAGSSNLTFTRQKASRIRGGAGPDPLLRLTRGNPLTKIMKSAVKESDEVVLHPNFSSSLIHPSDLVNVGLLSQNPDAKVALTHDDVWCDLLRDKVNYATLIKIARSYTSSADEYGCISLTKVSDSSNALDIERRRPVRGTEIPVLQEPIPGAREERNPDISIPAQASTTLRPVELSSGASDEGTPGISVPSQAQFTTPELPRLRDRDVHQRMRTNASTATSLEALDHQESHTAYQDPMSHWDYAGVTFERDQDFEIDYPPFLDLDRDVRQRRGEEKGKTNPSTATSPKALDHQESHAAYQDHTDPWDSAGAVFQRDQNFSVSGYPLFIDVKQQGYQEEVEEELKGVKESLRKLEDRLKEIKKKGGRRKERMNRRH